MAVDPVIRLSNLNDNFSLHISPTTCINVQQTAENTKKKLQQKICIHYARFTTSHYLVMLKK